MLITILKTTEQTPPSEETQSLPQLSFRSFVQTTTEEDYCIAPTNVESQIPFWIKQNYSNDESNNYFISFITEYYNWLYCGFKKEDVKLTPYDIEQLFNIDQVPDTFLDLFVKTYAPFIAISSIKNEDRQNLRKFIRSIKTDFLIRKGTEGAYRYLLKTLFNVNNIIIDYPKKYLLRLNGGKYSEFSWDYIPNSIIDLPSSFDHNNPIQNDILAGDVGYNPNTRPNLFGSALNEAVLPDNNFWQEHSYILTSDASPEDAINYKDTVLAGTHPAGTIAFFEQYVSMGEVVIPSDQPQGGIVQLDFSENPVIGRYLHFYPGITTDPSVNYNYDQTFYHTFDGITCSGINAYICTCCLSNCNPLGPTGASGPQHYFPKWDNDVRAEIEIPNGTLGHMTIGSFLELRRLIASQPSPNYDLKTCNSDTASCQNCD